MRLSIAILIPIVTASVATILLLAWLVPHDTQNSRYNSILGENRILRLKYEFIQGLIEIEPGEELELREHIGRNATLTIELVRNGDSYTLNFTVYVVGYSVYNEDGRRFFREFRRCVVFEYNVSTKRFYWQGKDVGVLLPLFQPLVDRIILFDAEFIPLGAESKISSYPPPSPVWASKVGTTLVYPKEGRVYMPELNRTWWLSELNVRPPIWDLYEKISMISGSDVLEIIHYVNNTLFGLPGVSIERNTGIMMRMSIPGLFWTHANATIMVNGKPVNEIPVVLLPYSLGLKERVSLQLTDVEFIP